MTGAFEDYAKFVFDDGNDAMLAGLAGKPYVSRVAPSGELMWEYEAIEDFTYHHRDQDHMSGKYVFKKGQKIALRPPKDDWDFMQDSSKLRKIGEFSTCCKNDYSLVWP